MSNQAELQTEIKMGRFDQVTEHRLDAMNARNRLFDEVQKGHTVKPIYRSPENPGNNPEVRAMLGNFSIDMTSLNLPTFN